MQDPSKTHREAPLTPLGSPPPQAGNALITADAKLSRPVPRARGSLMSPVLISPSCGAGGVLPVLSADAGGGMFD